MAVRVTVAVAVMVMSMLMTMAVLMMLVIVRMRVVVAAVAVIMIVTARRTDGADRHQGHHRRLRDTRCRLVLMDMIVMIVIMMMSGRFFTHLYPQSRAAKHGQEDE